MDFHQQCKATVHGAEETEFDAEEAAQKLCKAMKGLGTNEKTIIRVLTTHTRAQRSVIRNKFKEAFGRALEDDLKGDLGGNFLKLCLAMIVPAEEFNARYLHYALNTIDGTLSSIVIDILATKTNDEMQQIKKMYKELYNKDLDDDIADRVSNADLRRVLRALAQGGRSQTLQVDSDQLKEDVEDLHKAGVARLGTDEDVFTRLFVTRPRPQLLALFQAYQQQYQLSIQEIIHKEMSAETQRAFLAIVNYTQNPVEYFARCLNETMKGPGTDDERLIYLIVSRCEVDLGDIADKYEEIFNRRLKKDVKDDTRGDYQKLLVKIINQADED